MNILTENTIDSDARQWLKDQMTALKKGESSYTSQQLHDMFGKLNRGEAYLKNGRFIDGPKPVFTSAARKASRMRTTPYYYKGTSYVRNSSLFHDYWKMTKPSLRNYRSRMTADAISTATFMILSTMAKRYVKIDKKYYDALETCKTKNDVLLATKQYLFELGRIDKECAKSSASDILAKVTPQSDMEEKILSIIRSNDDTKFIVKHIRFHIRGHMKSVSVASKITGAPAVLFGYDLCSIIGSNLNERMKRAKFLKTIRKAVHR